MEDPLDTSNRVITVYPDGRVLLNNQYIIPLEYYSESGHGVSLSGFPRGITPFSYSVKSRGPSKYKIVGHTHPEDLSSLSIEDIAKRASSSIVTVYMRDGSIVEGELLESSNDDIRLFTRRSSPGAEESTKDIIQLTRKEVSKIIVTQLRPNQGNMDVFVRKTSFEGGRDIERVDNIMVEMEISSFRAFFQGIFSLNTDDTSLIIPESAHDFTSISNVTLPCNFDIRVSYKNDTNMTMKETDLVFKYSNITQAYAPYGGVVRSHTMRRKMTMMESRSVEQETVVEDSPEPSIGSVTVPNVNIMRGNNSHFGYSLKGLISFSHVIKLGYNEGKMMAKVKATIHHIHSGEYLIAGTRFVINQDERNSRHGEGIIKHLVVPRKRKDMDAFSLGTYVTTQVSESDSIMGNISHSEISVANPSGRGGMTRRITTATVTNIGTQPIKNVILLKHWRQKEELVSGSINDEKGNPAASSTNLPLGASHPFAMTNYSKYSNYNSVTVYTIDEMVPSKSVTVYIQTKEEY